MTKAPLLTVVMLVKDEALGIHTTLHSIKPFVDRWCILDTGSTDGTQAIIREAMEDVPGQLVEEPFTNFAACRNRVIELAGLETTFILTLDGDEAAINGDALRNYLEAHQEDLDGAYYVQILHDTLHYDSTRIARASAGWRYKGAVHEVLIGPDGESVGPKIPTFGIRRTSGDQKKRDARWERDVGVLYGELARSPNDTRATFYLGQTFDCLGRLTEAAAMYTRRISLGGWREEVFESKLRLARIGHLQKKPWMEVQSMFLDAYSFSPHRAEPLYEIANHYHEADNHPLAFMFAVAAARLPRPKDDRLFVRDDVYSWRLADLIAHHAWYIGEYGVGEHAARVCLIAAPELERPRVQANLQHYIDRKVTPGNATRVLTPELGPRNGDVDARSVHG